MLTTCGCAWMLALCLLVSPLKAEEASPLLNRSFTITNHEGIVFTNAQILGLSSNYVLLTSPVGPGKAFFTNLPSGVQAELAGRLAAQRLNAPDQPSQSSRRRFYERLIFDLNGKTDEEKIRAF